MALTLQPILALCVFSICGSLILVRCGYRLLSRCRVHPDCHRTWRADDACMAFALLPLATRTAVIYLTFQLNPTQSFSLPTESDAAARGISVAQLKEDYIMSHKLVLVARVACLIYLWCLKLCLLSFYSRFIRVFPIWKAAALAIRWAIAITFLAALIVGLTECRPITLFWEPDSDDLHTCRRSLEYFLTMGIFDMALDISLIVLPFPILWHSYLQNRQKAQLGILFGIGIFVVIITIVRLPLVINESLSSEARVMGANIEILGATIVANAAFYFALVKDFQRGHDKQGAGPRPSISDGGLNLVSRDSHSGHGPKTSHCQVSSARSQVAADNTSDSNHLLSTPPKCYDVKST